MKQTIKQWAWNIASAVIVLSLYAELTVFLILKAPIGP